MRNVQGFYLAYSVLIVVAIILVAIFNDSPHDVTFWALNAFTFLPLAIWSFFAGRRAAKGKLSAAFYFLSVLTFIILLGFVVSFSIDRDKAISIRPFTILQFFRLLTGAYLILLWIVTVSAVRRSGEMSVPGGNEGPPP